MDALQFPEKCVQVGSLNSDNPSVTVRRQFLGFNVTANCLDCQFKMSRGLLNSQPFIYGHKNIIPFNNCISKHLYKIALDKQRIHIITYK